MLMFEDQHPAVKAWNRLYPHSTSPKILEIQKSWKSNVFKLENVGYERSSIIAKRSMRAGMEIERTVYEEILPVLPIHGLRYYGYVEDPDPEFCWIFLENAGDEKYSSNIEEHRILAARWLGTMHASSTQVPKINSFHDRGLTHYLHCLREARDAMHASFDNPELSAEALQSLIAIVRQFDILDSRWDRLESFCHGFPRTFLHGSLKDKDIRIRRDESGSTLLIFDWEKASIGLPAHDLAIFEDDSLDALRIYQSVVEPSWPDFDLQRIRKLAHLGRVLRAIKRIHKGCRRLKYLNLEKSRNKMWDYHKQLMRVIQTAGLE